MKFVILQKGKPKNQSVMLLKLLSLSLNKTEMTQEKARRNTNYFNSKEYTLQIINDDSSFNPSKKSYL